MIKPLKHEQDRYFVPLAAEPAFEGGDRLVGVVADKAGLHELWLALREFRKSLLSWRKKGKRCPAPGCGVEIDDRADTCRTHGCGRKPKDGKQRKSKMAGDYRPPKGIL